MLTSEILTQAQDYIDDTTTGVSAQLMRSINRGYREVLAIPGAYWNRLISTTISTVAGTDQYAVSATLRNIIDIRNTTTNYSRYLDYMEFEDFVQLYPNVNTTTDRGTPTTFYGIGVSASSLVQPVFKVYPVPDAVYTLTVDGNRRVSDLATTDTPIFPEEYHHILANYAAWQFFMADLNSMYQEHKANWAAGRLALANEAIEGEVEDQQTILNRPSRYSRL